MPESKAEFEKFFTEDVPKITFDVEYDELWGHQLTKGGAFYDEPVARALMYKFYKAYNFDIEESRKNLKATLQWRKQFKPLEAAFLEVHNPDLEDIGVVTKSDTAGPNRKVITWNLYGEGNTKKLFGDTAKFIRYRIGLMEKGLQLLKFDDGENDYMTQVHDYKGVSFLRPDADVSRATKQIIHIFSSYYPEVLYEKYFCNVPTVLMWMYDVVKHFVGEKTRKKFVVLNDSNKLAGIVGDFVPAKRYGGKSDSNLKQMNVGDVKPTPYALTLIQSSAVNDIE